MRGPLMTGSGVRSLAKIVNGVSFFMNNGRVLTLENFKDRSQAISCGMTHHTDGLIAPGATGLHDLQGRPIVESYLRRDSGPCVEFPFGKPTPMSVPAETSLGRLGTVVFIPHVDFDHFGHMLTETAGWLSPLLEPEVCGLRQAGSEALVVLGGASERDVDRFRGVFDLPGDRVLSTLSIRSPHRCREALIARPTCINRHAIHERHFHAVRRLVNRVYGIGPETERELENIVTTSAKTYLSRSRLPAGSRTIREEEGLENRLAAHGWRVVHPEALPIVDQLATLKESGVVAGHIGSALHLLMYFGKRVRNNTVIGLGMGSGRMNANFSNQFRGQSMRFYHLCCLRNVRNGNGELRLTLPVETVVRNLEKLARMDGSERGPCMARISHPPARRACREATATVRDPASGRT